VQSIAPATTSGYRYAVNYNLVDPSDYRVVTDSGTIEAKLVVLAAGAMGTPVILQRSAAALGGVQHPRRGRRRRSARLVRHGQAETTTSTSCAATRASS